MSKKYGKTRPVPARQTAKQPVQAEKIIRHEGGKWVLYSHEGKVLGRHDSEEDAKKQEAAIEAHKHGDKAMGEGSGTEGGYAVPEEEEKTESATQECVSSKMPKLVEGGHDQDQAAAIAYSECGEKKKAFPAAAEKDEEEDDKESEEGTEETPAAEDEGAEEKPAAEDESSEEETPANEEAPPEESALDKPALEGKPQANAPAKPDAAGQPPPFGAPEAATPKDSDAESVDAASQPAARAESVYAQDLTDERRPGGVELFQRLIESAESELAALEPEAKVAVEQAIEALRNLAEQRYPDEDFGGVEPEEMSPTGSVAQPNPAEEAEEAAVTQNILDRYKDHQPSQQKCSGRGTMSKYQKSKRYAAAIVKAAADHMHGFRKLIGKKYGEDEHEETHDHARALDHLHGVLTKGDPDADEDEDERDEHDERVHDDHDDGDHDADDEAQDERESFRPSHEDHPYEHKDALEDEKGIDWSAINDALKPLRERVDRLDKVSSSLLSLTGKN